VFRQQLAAYTQSVRHVPGSDPYDIPLWSAVWDTMFDADLRTGTLSSPEVLGKILQDDLDFPMWEPPDPVP
jgi:hypothetical protein